MQIAEILDFADRAPATPSKRRSLIAACLAHALHDGYTDGLYAFLPVWQTQFGLSYAGLAIVRALYYGTMGGLQVPGDQAGAGSFAARSACPIHCSRRDGLHGHGVAAGLCRPMRRSRAGRSRVQHSASPRLAPRHGHLRPGIPQRARRLQFLRRSRKGDASRRRCAFAAYPRLASRDQSYGSARSCGSVWPAGASPPDDLGRPAQGQAPSSAGPPIRVRSPNDCRRVRYRDPHGLSSISAFLIHARGGTSPTVGLGLALLFTGGALGKATCSWLGEHLGVIGSVVATETVTALLIVTTLFLPLVPMLLTLPLLGIVLNGTSSVLYGTVPELAPNGDAGRAFAIFYTGVIGSGGLAPIAYGAIADHSNQTIGVLAAAATAALIVPMVLGLRPSLRR